MNYGIKKREDESPHAVCSSQESLSERSHPKNHASTHPFKYIIIHSKRKGKITAICQQRVCLFGWFVCLIVVGWLTEFGRR